MKARAVFRAVSPYLGVLGVAALLAALLGTIYFTWFDLQWTAFLAGILVAAILALVSRASRSEWILMRRTAQLAALRDRLAQETAARERAEQALAPLQDAGRSVGEMLPAMLARLDGEHRCRYHNRAFRRLAVQGTHGIEGRPLREVLGEAHYAAMTDALAQALAGYATRAERVHVLADGGTVRLHEQYLPVTDERGVVSECFLLATEMEGTAQPAAAPGGDAEHAIYADAIARELTDWADIAARLRAAIEHDEFRLYVQTVMPLAAHTALPPFYEILNRLQDEESSLLPPGVFLPLAQTHGLLPQLDRWVVSRLLRWAAAAPSRRNALYSVNLSAATLGDAEFAGAVREQLAAAGLPGAMLCFEFAEAEALPRPAAAEAFVRELRLAGCRVALCGVGRNLLPFELIRRLKVDFLKIDSRVIFNLERDSVELARVRAICRAARSMHIGTIAELVESEASIALLRAAGVDFAQGFAISQPRPLEELA